MRLKLTGKHSILLKWIDSCIGRGNALLLLFPCEQSITLLHVWKVIDWDGTYNRQLLLFARRFLGTLFQFGHCYAVFEKADRAMYEKKTDAHGACGEGLNKNAAIKQRQITTREDKGAPTMEKYEFTAEARSLMEQMQVPFAVYQFLDKRVVTLALSDGFCRLFGYADRAQAYYDMDHDMYKDTHPDDTARIANAAFRFATEGGKYEVIYRTKTKGSSDYRIVHAFGEHVYTETGVRLAHIWYADEGTYLEGPHYENAEFNRALSHALYERSLLKASYYDYLTGLPSISYFFELANTTKEDILERGGLPVMMYMDFSGMKFFNAKHGFAEGDRLLQSFAKELAQLFNSENCCHIGADHFAVISEDAGLEEKLQQLFRDCRGMNEGKTLPVHVGIYRSQLEPVHSSVACDRAKLACNALKGTYDSGLSYYSRELSDDAERRQYIIENLDRAIEKRWVKVYYQPIVRAANERVCNEEALARWVDPINGFLSPADFIPALESAGLIYKLDLFVLDEVLEKIHRQQTTGLHVVPHSINLSRADFDACDIVEEIRQRVDAAKISREKITIEITESIIGSDFDFMKVQIARFQELGFPVWMDDFGSGYSSLDVLQDIKFNLIKFDMSFMRKLENGDSGKIILKELMRMTAALGVDTICEGVETEAQVRFLQEIGCSKLQGFYYCKPVPFEEILERYRSGMQIGFENPKESEYYEAISRVNLYDLAVIATDDKSKFQTFFNTLPVGIMEVKDGQVRFVRTNQSYRDFMKRFFGIDLSDNNLFMTDIPFGPGSSFTSLVKQCCHTGNRAFFDEQMQDGSTIHSFARRIGTNPVTEKTAIAIAILSISKPDEGTTYADIARALAADYYNIYAVDLDSERFIEYTSPVGGDELAMERHGKNFFEAARRDTLKRIYEEDRESFLTWFTKENIVRELDEQGVFTTTYRLIDSGVPMYVNMKITRMQPNGNRIILGISIIDSQMKQQAQIEKMQREETAYTRIMALTGDYLSLYTVDRETGNYLEYSATNEYESLGFAKTGDDFFLQGMLDGKRTVYEEDLPGYLQSFTRENVLAEIDKKGAYQFCYRLVIGGKPKRVVLKIVSVRERDGNKLIASVRAWKERARQT